MARRPRSPDPRIEAVIAKYWPDDGEARIAEELRKWDQGDLIAKAAQLRLPLRPTDRGPRITSPPPPPGHVVGALAEIVREAREQGRKMQRVDAWEECARRLGAWPTRRMFLAVWEAQVPPAMRLTGRRRVKKRDQLP